MKTKRTPEDALFSDFIRYRDKWTCQRCGKVYPEKTQGLHCSHFFGRRHQNTRYDPENACAHCFTCHQYLGENPVEFSRWIKSYLGVTRAKALEERAHTKRTKTDKAELKANLKKMLAEVKGL